MSAGLLCGGPKATMMIMMNDDDDDDDDYGATITGFS